MKQQHKTGYLHQGAEKSRKVENLLARMNGMSLQTALYMNRTFWELSFINCMVDSLESCVSEIMKGLAPASSTL